MLFLQINGIEKVVGGVVGWHGVDDLLDVWLVVLFISK